MQSREFKFKFNEIFLYPIGDIHIGEKCFDAESRDKLQGYVNFIKRTPNAYAFLMGDLVNCATLDSPGGPFAQDMDLNKQIHEVVRILEPIKGKILGAISGNHEERLEKYNGYNPTISVCDQLGIYYFGYSGVIFLRLGCKGNHSPRATFVGYLHHTTGGGGTIGGKMNRVDKLRDVMEGCDFLCGAHNHMLGCAHVCIKRANPTLGKIETIRQMLVDTGGYLNYNDSYAEMKQLPPVKIGSPRLHLIIKRNKKDNKDVIHKDIHVSI
jgi:hypothetical protein